MSLESIKNLQKTIDGLLRNGTGGFVWGTEADKARCNSWILEELHDAEDCSVGFVHISKVGFGPCGEHIHPDSKEYLIVVHGSIVFNVDGKDIRVVKAGECCVVEKGQSHYSRPLEDDTKLVYVCVPQDPYLRPKKEGHGS